MFNGWRTIRKTTDDDDRDAHKSEKFLAFFVMLSGHSNGSPCEFIHFSAVPVSFASSPSAFASSLLSKRFASYTCTHFNDRRYSEFLSTLTTPDFNSGGRPSNAYAGLIPFSTIRIVL